MGYLAIWAWQGWGFPDFLKKFENQELESLWKVTAMFSTPQRKITSILFSASSKLETLYAEFQEKGITVGDLIEMPQMKVFNFADSEGNYFAVREV